MPKTILYVLRFSYNLIWIDSPISSDMDVTLLPRAAGLSPYFFMDMQTRDDNIILFGFSVVCALFLD
jgi:hypothetical protein